MKKFVILLCIVALAVSSALIVGCGNGGGGGDDEAQVKEVAEKYAKALTSFDFAAIIDIMSEKDLEGMSDEEIEEAKKQSAEMGDEMGDMTFDIDFEIGEVEISGDEATVTMTTEFAGQKTDMTVYLVKENGEWKVDFARSTEESMDLDMDESMDESVDETTE